MNSTNVPVSSREMLERVADGLPQLTPQLRKAATYVLENPNEISVSSIREMASAASVRPNTFVRMARSFGFDGYEDFRELFRAEIRNSGPDFEERARWLQSQSRGGRHERLFADMAGISLQNLEKTFTATSAGQIKSAADAIVASRHTYVLGVGINHTLASSFAYMAEMALANVHAIPRSGSLAMDEVLRAGPGDVLLAMTFKPYRTDVIEVVEYAREQGVTIIGISDSPASPVIAGSEHGFVVNTDTPQFFTSTFTTAALLETLMAFVVADAPAEVVESIEHFHTRRAKLGMYQLEADEGTDHGRADSVARSKAER